MKPSRVNLIVILGLLATVLFFALSPKGFCAVKVKRLSIATGGTGGTYYPYGGAMAAILNKYVPGVEATAEVTGASVENIRLISAGEAQIGLVMNDTAYQALKGIAPFDRPLDIRTLFLMYPHFLHVVTLEEYPITKISDLKGRKVSVGAPGSGTEVMSRQVLQALGITYKDFNVFYLSFAENTQALRDKVIHVGIWSVGPPTSSIMDLATTHRIRIVGFSDQELKKINENYPYYSSMVLPANTYKGVNSPVKGPSVWNTVIVRKDMPEDLAYQIVRAILEHVEDLIRVYPGAKYTTPEAILKHAVLPLHPGVVRYLKEKGLQVPSELLPPEMPKK